MKQANLSPPVWSNYATTPKKSTGTTNRQNALIICVSAAAAVAWMVVMSIWLTSLLANGNEDSGPPSLRIPGPIVAEDNVVDVLPVSPVDLWPDNTESFDLFRTLRDCDPNAPDAKCGVSKTSKSHRVAIVSPPGAVADFVTSWIKAAVEFHSKDENRQDIDINLIQTSHVPPYGYGKNHGLTKIIRVASFPMSLATADTVRFASLDLEGGTQKVSLDDMKQVGRQLVRWHCRLSHVAAHTPLLTITMEELLEDPWEIEERLCTFLGLTSKSASDELEEVDEGDHMDTEELARSVDPILDDASDLLNQVDRQSGVDSMESVLNELVAQELKATNDLTAWPCPSFWNVGERKPSHLSPFARRVAQAMSPDCSAEYATCTVKRDKCEERGDALCKD